MAKFRKDFVTNSSSSSFICDICGNVESGYDMCLSDAGMMRCVNDHTFCIHEALDKPSKKEMIEKIIQNEWNIRMRYDYKLHERIEKIIPKEELEQLDSEELWCDFYTEGGYYDVPECVCPICNFIEYDELDLKRFLKKEYNVSEEEVFGTIKDYTIRDNVYTLEYIIYVCKKFDLNPAQVVSSWKDRFKSYSEFYQYTLS